MTIQATLKGLLVVAAVFGLAGVGYVGLTAYQGQRAAEDARFDAECTNAAVHLAARAAGHPLIDDHDAGEMYETTALFCKIRAAEKSQGRRYP